MQQYDCKNNTNTDIESITLENVPIRPSVASVLGWQKSNLRTNKIRQMEKYHSQATTLGTPAHAGEMTYQKYIGSVH